MVFKKGKMSKPNVQGQVSQQQNNILHEYFDIFRNREDAGNQKLPFNIILWCMQDQINSLSKLVYMLYFSKNSEDPKIGLHNPFQ